MVGPSFNSRSRVGSDGRHARRGPEGPSFNSRSRVGSDVLRGQTAAAMRVSIHAPAWGATRRMQGVLLRLGVSIHAPAWGATRRHCTPPAKARFQFTLPRGERPARPATTSIASGFNSRSRVGSDLYAAFCEAADVVSIHAPAWGATVGWPRRRQRRAFQFTLPRGERPLYAAFCEAADVVSIHAPAWGATHS